MSEARSEKESERTKAAKVAVGNGFHSVSWKTPEGKRQ